MKKNGILNSDISRVLSYMGHTDRICIGDCGLPIPDETERIDLALRFGKIEAIILAEEIKEQNPGQLADILSFFEENGTGCMPSVKFVSHTELKKMTEDCKAVIRTGEASPYSNIILQSDCIF